MDVADRLTVCSVEEADEPGRFIGTETDLLQHADAGALSIAGADNLLDVKMLRRQWVKLLRIERLPADFQLALPHALSPLGMSVAEALHLELQDWFEDDRACLAVVINQVDLGGPRQPRAGNIVHPVT